MKWWGEFSFEPDQKKVWQIGERAIVIQQGAHEWLVWNATTDQESGRAFVINGDAAEEWLVADNQSRYLQRVPDKTLAIFPALADRSFVARPSTPLKVLPGEQIQLYISTPLWFQVKTMSGTVLVDVPFWRPSDSWFGPSPIQGEICYAKYTDARLQLDLLERRPYRAITTINVYNKHKDSLVIDRFNVPVPSLGLFFDSEYQLWTETVNVVRENNGIASELDIGVEPPKQVLKSAKVCEPRMASDNKSLLRNISSLFL